MFDFGGAPKTDWSSRADEHHDTDGVTMTVESGAERLVYVVECHERRRCRGPAAAGEKRRSASAEGVSLHDRSFYH